MIATVGAERTGAAPDASIDTAGYSYWTGLTADWTSNSDDCDWTEAVGYYATEPGSGLDSASRELGRAYYTLLRRAEAPGPF